MDAPGTPRRPSRATWILAVCCVSQFMVILDLSIVNVALPSIQLSLGFSAPDLQWVVDAYSITFAGFLMLGGRVADYFGQRRTFVSALTLFALASLAGGLAPNQFTLVVGRGVQGLGGALMAACSLAIITSSFEPGPKLNRAIGTWAAMNGLGGSAGVLFGGLITQEISWRWVLLINPPIAIVTALIAYTVVADRRRATDGPRFDVAGALTLTLGQMVLVYGVVKAGLEGWGSSAALGPIVGGIFLLVLFGLIEARSSHPLIPFKDLTSQTKNANTIVLLFSGALFPMWILSSLYLQQVLGLSPLDTGLIFLPMTLVIMAVASQAGKLVSRFGVRTVLGSGLTMLTVGMLLLTRVHSSGSGIVYVMIPGLLVAAGIAMSIVPSTIAATQGSKAGQAGLASGMVNTSRQIGGGLGIAVLITLATQRSSHLIGSGHGVPQALTSGFKLAYFIAAGLAGLAALLTFLTVRKAAASKAAHGLRRAPMPIAVGVVVAAFIGTAFATAGNHGPPIGAYLTQGTYRYASEPLLHPPVINATGNTKHDQLAPGYILMTNFYDLSFPPMVGQSGPLILDDNLEPVWFSPVPENVVAANLTLQTYRGKPALAWWQGEVTNTGQTLNGEDVVVDQHYRPVARVRGAGGWILTLHEIIIRGHRMWVTANKNLPMNLSRFGGAYNGAVIDSAVQEYDIDTGKLLFSWDALGHIPLSDSRAFAPTNGFPWDAYHVNSVSLLDNGDLLVSMRNTWAAYRVSTRTGQIEWALGGRHSSFRFGPEASFEWQHDVMTVPGRPYITMFDDHCCQITGGGTYVPATGPSRGLALKIDQTNRTATLAAQYLHGSNFDADYMGNLEPLPGGNQFVGWGSAPYFTEFSHDGKPLLDAALPHPDLSYRTYREPWRGFPTAPPKGASGVLKGKPTVYASWNGSTEVAAWHVLAGPDAGHLTLVAAALRSGFETPITVPQRSSVYQVQALDARNRVIGSSRPFG